jgi:hypothetical protein
MKEIYGGMSKESLDPFMISYTLQKITPVFTIEKRYGQTHKLDKKIRDQVYINPCSQMKDNPVSDKFKRKPAGNKNQLCN